MIYGQGLSGNSIRSNKTKALKHMYTSTLGTDVYINTNELKFDTTV